MRCLGTAIVFLFAQLLEARYIHDRLIGKSTFTEESLNRYLTAMDRLNRIQEQLLNITKKAIGTFENRSSQAGERPDMKPYLFEGDIILSEEQMTAIIDHAEQKLARRTHPSNLKEEIKRTKRTLTSNLAWRWTTFPIPFYINTNTGVDSGAVLAGVQTWMDNTCITFQQLSSLPQTGSALEFIQGDGCYSNIGRYAFGSQQISIGIGCTLLGTVAHEIGHSLGYFHEHTRFDRDAYVKVLSQNIESGYASQFSENPPSAMVTFGVGYDLGSAMHYPTNGFSSNGGDTLQPIDSNYYYTIGQRIGLSFYDVKKINFAYCNSSCTTQLACQNGGYTDPKQCSQCRCPFGFGGTLCTQAATTTTANCGQGNLAAAATFQNLSMSGGGACNWIITAPAGHHVLVQFSAFSFTSVMPCYADFLELRYGVDVANTGARFCGTSPSGTITSQTTQLVMLYRSAQGRFTMQYRYDPQDQVNTITTTSTTPTTTRTTKPMTTTTTVGAVGQWSQWSRWSPCGTTCGGCGTQTRWRICSTNICVGASTQTQYCNTRPCPGRFCCPPFVFGFPIFCVLPMSAQEQAKPTNIKWPKWPPTTTTGGHKFSIPNWIWDNDDGSGQGEFVDEKSSPEYGLEIVSDAVFFRGKTRDSNNRTQENNDSINPGNFYKPLVDDI